MLLRTAAVPNPSGIPHVYHPALVVLENHDLRVAMKRAKEVLVNATSRHKAVVGITSHPERRALKYKGYVCMVVIATTPPTDSVRKRNAFRELAKDLEREIYSEFGARLDNERDGGAGREMPGPRFFVYICIPEATKGYDPYIYEVLEERDRREQANRRQKQSRQKNPVVTESVEVTGPDDPLDPWP
jgi:hypothetical protein